MKIKCKYCDNYFDDTNEICPHCHAPNDAVVRTNKEQPITIEGLKKWYNDRQLPPYEVTRFFIGENYTAPRAFGIYRDDRAGNFIVYKNKDNGERAVRYEGSDEAYAVNELLQRLKEEIINQKNNQVGKNNVGARSVSGTGASGNKSSFRKLFLIIPLALLIIVGVIGFVLGGDSGSNIRHGYYLYNDEVYCCYGSEVIPSWAKYANFEGQWTYVFFDIPKELQKAKTADKYFLGETFDSSWGVPDFKDTQLYLDSVSKSKPGYYQCNGNTFYHYGSRPYDGWFIYDTSINDWSYVDIDSMPEEMKHSSTAQDFYTTPTWDSSVTATNFTESKACSDYRKKLEQEKPDSWNNSNDSDFNWSSSDSWDSGSTNFSSDW